jgi:hypothetical protein
MPMPSDVLYLCVRFAHLNFSQLRVQDSDNSIAIVIMTSKISMNLQNHGSVHEH